jgi:hypothetical protein
MRTSCKSTSPAVSGLRILDSAGGHFKIMFLYKSEYLKRMKMGDEASIATTIGALKSGASTACIGLPKHKVMIMSIAMHLNAKCRSTPPALLCRAKAAQSSFVISTQSPSEPSIADCENERFKTSLRFLASAYVRKPKLDLSSLKLLYRRASLSQRFLLL